MKKKIDVSICIVSFNTREHLKKCLTSLYRFTKQIAFEIIVVDNGSHDGSAQMIEKEFSNVRFMKNKTNHWFSGANNQALHSAQGTYIFFLNPDTWITTNVIKNLKEWMDKHGDVGACEPRQIDGRGHVAPTGSTLNTWWIDLLELTACSRLFGSVGRIGLLKKPQSIVRFRKEKKDRARNWQTEVVSGAALFARTNAVKKVNGFSERLKLYYTDTDLCRKLLLDGQKIWHVGQYSLYHALSVSTSQLSWEKRSKIYAQDAETYYSLIGERIQGRLLSALMMINSRIVRLSQ